MIKVSIITTTYNSAKTVASTIESVLSQTYPNIEYWIIDGNSSDRTLDIIKKYQERFNGRLHYLSAKVRETSSAFSTQTTISHQMTS